MRQLVASGVHDHRPHGELVASGHRTREETPGIWRQAFQIGVSGRLRGLFQVRDGPLVLIQQVAGVAALPRGVALRLVDQRRVF